MLNAVFCTFRQIQNYAAWDMVLGLVAIGGILALFFIPIYMAKKRERSGIGWFFISIFTSPLVAIVLLLILGDSDVKIRREVTEQVRRNE